MLNRFIYVNFVTWDMAVMLGGCGSVQELAWALQVCGDAVDSIELADGEPSQHQMWVGLVDGVLKTKN